MYKHLAPRCPVRFDLALLRFSISHPFSLSLSCLSPPPSLSFSLSLFSPSSFAFAPPPFPSRPQGYDWRIDSSRVVQSGLRHRVCVFQKCWRRLSRRSSPSPAPSVFVLVHPRSLRHSSQPPPLSSPPTRLLLVSKSMGRVLAVERARIRDQSPRAWGIEGSPDLLRGFDPSQRTRDMYLISPL